MRINLATFAIDKEDKDYIVDCLFSVGVDLEVIENSFIEDKVFFSPEIKTNLLHQALSNKGVGIKDTLLVACADEESLNHLLEWFAELPLLHIPVAEMYLTTFDKVYTLEGSLDDEVEKLTNIEPGFRNYQQPQHIVLKMDAVLDAHLSSIAPNNNKFNKFINKFKSNSVKLEGLHW